MDIVAIVLCAGMAAMFGNGVMNIYYDWKEKRS